MLGKHYYPPSDEDHSLCLLQKCFQGWLGKANSEERKKLMLDFLNAHVKVFKTDDLILMTGLVAPLAAMGLKKSSQHVPQIKRIRLDLVPDIIFVPTFAVATLFFVKIVQLKKGPISE
ncbi:hypothetical protein KSP40_PGU011387 [Platanthera guangdongensis]|uniref:Uncharacterized protein n=1 Tax=Platanthera guangdongensis TaxID=2320717 RepID=A0ABR2LQY0_9ASPA